MSATSASLRVSRVISHLCSSSSSSSSSSSTSNSALSISMSSCSATGNGSGGGGGAGGYECILVETRGRVGLITLHRPHALNALNSTIMAEVSAALAAFQKDENIGVVILTGAGTKAFAAGADIKEMLGRTIADQVLRDNIAVWEAISKCKIPLIAAVNGLALGGGCEIAMMCDIILASENAKFGQPEIKIGTIPGAGGTQRLPRTIGKSKAMEMVLTGNMISAQDAERWGLVSRVVPQEQLLNEAFKLANQIASLSKPVVSLCKESVNAALETPLSEGVRMERKIFHSTFGLKDRTEGMDAFANKRAPKWTNQ